MRCTNWLALLAISASLADGQSAAVSPAFDAASVKIHAAGAAEQGGNGAKNLSLAAAAGLPDGPRPVGSKQGPSSLVYKSVSMSDFAERLGGPPPIGLGERVVDGTGLTGAFDITLKVNSESFVGNRDEFADFLKAAIEQQFGLKIERRKIPLDTLVIDQGNRIPVEN
jgi:uncharacterized protein (TIGR03435 family)